MELIWPKNHTIQNWRELLSQSPQANWMQSWPYAKASYARDYKATKLGLIIHNGGPIGFMALQQIQLGPIKLWNLNRGPLWFSPTPHADTLNDFALLFNDHFPRKIMCRRRWLPEWENNESAQQTLTQTGFQILPQTYQTIWLNLRKSEADLRAELKQKWRNCLNKGLRSELEIRWDWHCQNLDYFLQQYEVHKNLKNYLGPSKLFIKEEVKAAIPFKEACVFWAMKNNQRIAGILILIHGKTASYRLGWNTQEGRAYNAHYALLWNALMLLKEKNIEAFDLGGIKPEEAQGVSHFKLGMGGQHVKLLGLFK